MTVEQIIYSMDKYGVDFSLFSDIEAVENDHQGNLVPPSFQKPQNTVLRESIDQAKKYPDKLGILIWMKYRRKCPTANLLN